jgi:hypothetical protein
MTPDVRTHVRKPPIVSLPTRLSAWFKWSERRDSNSRPPVPQTELQRGNSSAFRYESQPTCPTGPRSAGADVRKLTASETIGAALIWTAAVLWAASGVWAAADVLWSRATAVSGESM